MAAGVSDSQGAAGKHDTEEAPGVRCAACLPAWPATHPSQLSSSSRRWGLCAWRTTRAEVAPSAAAAAAASTVQCAWASSSATRARTPTHSAYI